MSNAAVPSGLRHFYEQWSFVNFGQDNPQHFPIDYFPAIDSLALMEISHATIAGANFLDRRLPLSFDNAQIVSITQCRYVDVSPAVLFHTAFCGSTLLSRALQAPPAVVALREPSALLALAMATLRPEAFPPAQIERAARVLLGLLGRPWEPAGRVLIKPTNQVNRILPMLLRLSPASRAVLLYSSLEQFILSCLKKLPEAETRVHWMAQALLPGTQLEKRLGIPVARPFNLVEAVVLTWYAQMEIFALALSADEGDRLRSIDIDVLLAEPQSAVAAAAGWLQLQGAHEGLEARVVATFSRSAKSQSRAFDSNQRNKENTLVRERFGPLIRQALQWADEVIAPAAILPTTRKPLLS